MSVIICANLGLFAITHIALMYFPQSNKFLIVLKALAATCV